MLEKIPQGAGAFRRGCRGCGKTDALNREGRSLSCRRKKNAARQAKSAGQKNGCLRKCRKVPERLLQAPGVRENGCAEPGRAVVVMPPKEKCGASGKERGQKRLLDNMPQGVGAFCCGRGVAGKRMRAKRRAPAFWGDAVPPKGNAVRQTKSVGSVFPDRKKRICRGRTL